MTEAALTLGPDDIERLKARARDGDADALQQLRESGYFERRAAERKGFPTSHAQKRLWVLDRMDDGSAAYNVPVALQLHGPLDAEALRRAIASIVHRHESLRSAIRDIDGEPRQFIESELSFDVDVRDLRGEADPATAAMAAAESESARPFDLSRAPLVRASILRLADERHVLLLTAHHIVFDQWSSDVFVRELAEGYQAFSAGREPARPPLAIQYKDFAVWQNAQLAGPETERHRQYWARKLGSGVSPLELPADRARPPVQTFRGGAIVKRLDASAFAGLEACARRDASSMVMAIAAAVKVLLHRYTGQDDIVIGTTTAGRDRQELAGQIGFYVNALALRDRIDGAQSFRAVLAGVRQTATEAYEHQAYPFDRLVDDLAIARDPSRSPLFDVMLMVNDDTAPALELEGLRVTPFDYGHVAAKYDLTLDFVRASGGWTLRLIYNTDLYERRRMERLVEHFERLTASAVEAPDVPIAQLTMLDAGERRTLLAWSAGPTRPFASDQTIADLFEAQAARTPAAAAIRLRSDGGASTDISYAELNARADSLGAQLPLADGCEPSIAVMIDRGADRITALLAVLKAGATYLPLDPALPLERLTFAVRDSGAAAIITDGANAARARELGVARVIDVGERGKAGERASGRAGKRAYIIYTSGSTGVPKGVEVEHRGFVNMIAAQIAAFDLRPSDVVLQFASCSFDASLSEIFMALLSGACLVCPDDKRLKDPIELLRLIRDEGISVVTLSPDYIRALGFTALGSLRTLITAGQSAEPDRGVMAAAGCRYFNAYGPTEFSVCATLGLVPPDTTAGANVAIGRPIANAEVLVLDVAGGLQPVGVPGELCLAGEGLARGYLGRPDLTATAFPAHPFRPGERMYRTGDRARWREDGTLEFLGRLDQQVKIRGYRIEPGEVEAVLKAQPGVRDAVVVPQNGLVAYVETDDGDPEARLRDGLARTLPEYMIPGQFVALAKLPRSVSGKVDRAALPEPQRQGTADLVKPRDEVEGALAKIWEDVLGVESVGIHDRFLDLGGNSMKAILMVSRVLRDLGTRLPIRDVFEHGTIAALSRVLNPAATEAGIPALPSLASYELSHAQRRLWTIDRMGEGAGAYNIAGAIRLTGLIDASALRAALDALAERHESLRTTFVDFDGRPRQVVHERLPLDFGIIDLGGGGHEAAARTLIEEDAPRPFDLAKGPLFRTRLFRFEGGAVFYLNIHHIISDGWSLEVFFRELVALLRPRTPDLPALRIQYKDFAAWQRSSDSKADRDYWLTTLSGELPVLDLPTDRPRPAVKSFRGSAVTFTLDADLSDRFNAFARAHEATSVAMWLSLLYALIHRYTEAADIIVGVPATFREHPDLEHQIGYFVNMIPLRIGVGADEPYRGLLQRVRDRLRASFEHKNYPYDQLVDELDLRRDMSRNPLFDVAVSIQERTARPGQKPGFDVSAFPFAGRTSKFDLTLFASETEHGGWDVVLEYDTDLFDAWRIERMGVHLGHLLRSVLDGAHDGVGALEIMDAQERAEVCDRWNQTSRPYPRDAGLVELFREIVTAQPDAIAVESANRRLSYRELDEASDRLAAEIARLGGTPEVIPVLLSRSERVPVALLATLKAGAAYAPIDPSWPQARVDALLRDLNATVVIEDQGVSARLASQSCERSERLATAGTPEPRNPGTGASLAYIMYTSGSTGVPKGVLVDQRSVTRLVRNTGYLSISQADRFLHYSALAFDASTLEIWGALLNGATVCLPPAGESPGGAEMREWLGRFRPTVIWLTASVFNQLAEFDSAMFSGVRTVLTGGERLSPTHVNMVRDACPSTVMINGYGPTENTTFSLCHRIDRRYETDIPLGRPIANSRAYIVDSRLCPVPVGVVGEILVAGDGVARGYLNDEALTRERFVADPFVVGARAYRTRDRGCWRQDGTIVFVGRSDAQVKVRGYRVEPGEIETALRSAGASEAAVLARASTTGAQELVAYVVVGPGLEASALRERLRAMLPPYMIPAHVVKIDQLPLTANGKLDRRRLPDPPTLRSGAPTELEGPSEMEPPTFRSGDHREVLLAKAWADVLGRAEPGLDDVYFDLGGDSIQAIQIASRLRRAGWLLRVRDVFQHPTVRALAPRLRRVEEPAASTEPSAAIGAEAVLSPIQEWFFQRLSVRRPGLQARHFNQSVLLRSGRPLRVDALQVALRALWDRHAALRATFKPDPAGAIRSILGSAEPDVRVLDLTESADPQDALRASADRLQASFDLAAGPLFKAALYRTTSGDRLFLCAHHLVVDTVSWRILLEDLETAYGQAERGLPIDLGAPSASYAAWSTELSRRLKQPVDDGTRAYWARVECARTVPLPYDLADTDPGVFGDTDIVTLTLSAGDTARLLNRTFKAYGARVDELLTTAVARTVSGFTGHPRVVMTNEGHGRESEWLGVDVSRTVGWFTSLYPVVLDLSTVSIGEDIKRVKEVLRRVPHGGIGAPETGHAVSFNYLGQFDGTRVERALFAAVNEPHGADIGADVPRSHHLELSGAIAGGQLTMTIAYSERRYLRDTMERLGERLQAELLAIIEHCDTKPSAEKTPVDFTASSLSLDDYARFLRDAGLRSEDIDDIAHLSPMQEGLLYQRRLHSTSTAYHVQMDFVVRGTFDAGLYQQAWSELARRHPVLRTAFFDEGLPQPLQVVFREVPFEFTREDASSDANLPDRYRARDLARPFDMRSAPLWRIAVFRLAPDRHRIIWSYHHILIDGWSLAILYRQLSEVYAALEDRRQLAPVPERPFTAFVRWLERTDIDRAKQYWASYLAGVETRTAMPRRPGATGDAYVFAERTFDAGDRLSTLINQTAARLGVTTYTIVQAAWALVLSRYTDGDDVVFGSIVSGRPAALEHVDETVGLFINAVPVRVRLDRSRTFAETAQALQRDLLEQSDFHSLPLADIQRLAPLGRDLFDHLLVFENYPGVRDDVGTAAVEGGLIVESFEAHDESHYNLNVVIVPGHRLQFRTSFNTNVHPEDWVERFTGHLFTALERACEGVHDPIGGIDVMTAAERTLVLESFQGRRRPDHGQRLPTIVARVREHARAIPEATAIRCGSTSVSYAELDEQSDRCAAWLVDRWNVGADRRVAVLMGRSPRLVAVLLGVLKAGGAYVPIDPGYPRERVSFLLDDAGADVVLTDDVWDQMTPATVREIPPPESTDLAYVIYTSGSTGRPKGCQIEHRNLSHYLDWAARTYFGDPPDLKVGGSERKVGGSERTEPRTFRSGVFGLYSSLAFDLTVTSLFLPLWRGRTLHVLPQEVEIHDALRCMLDAASGIDAIKLTPSHISLIAELGLQRTGVTTAIVGGEALRDEHVRTLLDLNPRMAVFNEYGPTETTVGCIVKRIDRRDDAITIGRPIDDTRIHILDRERRPAPIGVAGEIFIAGAGVGRGYLNRPDTTREKFVEDGYRTGDLGRWLPDGDIDYLGRSDDQIKIRGHRIEPGEIEAAILSADEGVDEALVMARRLGGATDDVLVAYLRGRADVALMRGRLADALPDALVPTHFVLLDRFPLTSNGKVDRAALPPPDLGAAASSAEWATATEANVASIWRQVLGIDTVGRHDKFFSLGGHSLKATQIVSRIFRDLGVKVSLKEFFEDGTIAALAARVDSRSASTMDQGIPRAPDQSSYVLSPAQHRLWLLHHQLPGGETAYNIPFALEIEGAELDLAALEGAFGDLTARHESLRTAFELVNGEPRQRVIDFVGTPFEVVDLREDAPADAERSARRIAEEQAHRPFDLAAPPLLRVTVVRMPRSAEAEAKGEHERRALLLLTIHHIVGDGWSMVILTRELDAMYRARCAGRREVLPALRIHYKDYAEWQHRQSWSDAEAWWLAQLNGAPDQIALPYDWPPGGERDFRGDVIEAVIEPGTVDALRALGSRRGATLAQVTLSLFQLALYRLSGQADLCVGMSVANRSHADLEGLVGFFVNLVPIRTRLSEDMELDELIDQVARRMGDAFEHDCPFDGLVRRLGRDRVANRQPLINVVYAFQRFDDLRLEQTLMPDPHVGRDFSPGNTVIRSYPIEFRTSKFDLTLYAADEGEGGALRLVLEYDTGLFKPATATRMLDVLRRFAAAAAEQLEGAAPA